MRSSVCIVLGTYNGAAYVAGQIESILAQSLASWTLLIRDDGSGDETIEIIRKYARRDGRITLLEEEPGNLGAKENFSLLLQRAFSSGCDYIAMADQDDVWYPTKLEWQVRAMREMEKAYPDSPLLVHSDLELVDRDLEQIAPSFMQYQGIWHEPERALEVLMAQNFVTGCAALVNRRLLEFALPIPDVALMHDWWLALCAAAFGHLGYLDEPLVKYRQHAGNEIGAKRLAHFLNPFSGQWQRQWVTGRKSLFVSMKQAEALAHRIAMHDPEHAWLSLVRGYASLGQKTPLARVVAVRDLGVHMQSRVRHVLMLLRLLSGPRRLHEE